MIMVELISDDEDDDDLSNKAYEVKSFHSNLKCLEVMGKLAVGEIIRRIKQVIDQC